MRCWKSPFRNEQQISSVIGTPIRIVRVPLHLIGTCVNEQDFNDATLACTKGDEDDSRKARARKSDHNVIFTHGDLFPWNILVEDGHLSAILDWECSGWYPEYWEITTAWRSFEAGD